MLDESSSGYLVGDRLSLADLGVLECLLATQDYYPARLQPFTRVQVTMIWLSLADLGVLECLLVTQDYYPARLQPFTRVQVWVWGTSFHMECGVFFVNKQGN